MAAQACQSRFVGILTHEGFQLGDVSSARLEFEVPDPMRPELFTCRCVLKSTQGGQFLATMSADTYWSQRGRDKEDPFDVLRKLRTGG